MLQKKNLQIIFFVFIILILFSYISTASIKLEPARIIINSKLGERNTGVIEVINNTERQLLLQAYLYDWSLDERDSLVTHKPGTLDNSLNTHIKFNPRSFILDPGQRQIVRYTITTPESLEQELRGIVFFENATEMVDAATGALVKTQIGTVIYLVPDQVKYNFKMKEVRFLSREDNELQRFLVIMENGGKAHLRFAVDYKIINENSELIEEGTLDQYVLLPEYERGLVFSAQKELQKGKYKLILNYQFINNKRQKSYEIPFSID